MLQPGSRELRLHAIRAPRSGASARRGRGGVRQCQPSPELASRLGSVGSGCSATCWARTSAAGAASDELARRGAFVSDVAAVCVCYAWRSRTLATCRCSCSEPCLAVCMCIYIARSRFPYPKRGWTGRSFSQATGQDSPFSQGELDGIGPAGLLLASVGAWRRDTEPAEERTPA